MAINRDTSFSGSDLDIGMAQAAQQVLDEAPSLGRWSNRSQEARMRVNDKVEIDNYHFDVDGTEASTMVFADRPNEKADYQESKEFSISHQIIRVDQGGENSFRSYKKDIERSGRGRQRVADGSQHLRNLAVNARENNMVGYFGSLATYTTKNPVAADLPLLNNNGANGNAGKIYATSFGEAANTVSNVDGALLGDENARTATARAFVDGLTNLRLRMRRRNVVLSESGTVIGTDPGAFAFVCPPEVGRTGVEALRQLEIPNEQLNRDIYLNSGAFSSEAFAFQISGIPAFVSNSLPVPSSATGGFVCYLMTPNAIYYGEDQVTFWSQAPAEDGGINPGPFYSYHQVFTWGRKLVNPECMIKVTVRTAAPA